MSTCSRFVVQAKEVVGPMSRAAAVLRKAAVEVANYVDERSRDEGARNL
jgi:hypothetical protein